MRTRAELDDPRLRLVLAIEGVEALEGDPDAFEDWWERGVRSASLTWNYENEFAGGIDTPDQGLTGAGRTLVRRFAELGVVLDLAHASEQTWRDVIEEGVPFSVTHAGCRRVFDHPRNLDHWQLEALAERGGVLGVLAIRFFIDPETPTLARWVDHLDHAVSVMGIEHVGIGADFVDQVVQIGVSPDGNRPLLEGFARPTNTPRVVDALLDSAATRASGSTRSRAETGCAYSAKPCPRPRLPAMAELPLKGSCLCGQVRFEVTEDPVGASYCPLHALPEAHGYRGEHQRADRPRVADHPLGRGTRPSLRARNDGFPNSSAPPAARRSGTASPTRASRSASADGRLPRRPRNSAHAPPVTAYAAEWEPIPDHGLPETRNELRRSPANLAR